MLNLGAQYYRAPFPEKKYWHDDFKRIRDSGLNTVQLWVLWAWVEPKPGQFCFDDYDALVELADNHGLGVVLSTIAEIQPYWIHREVPGSEMITHLGHKVVSSNRCECHFGLTPGGCTDHPGVRERMRTFLEQVATRYRSAGNLRGWDAWNELRWNVQADGFVCYCDHTLAAFRRWLDGNYGGLDGLNRIWKRRYGTWDEVMPGKLPDRTYTEMMAFEHFLTWRANQHGKARYEIIKALDPDHPVTLHAATPSPLMAGGGDEHPINRGNDWFYADDLDGVGCSSFPKWGGIDDADFGMRVEFVKSAARGKAVWLSEVQGGRAAEGFNISQPVDALSQQRWLWNGIACGANTILFWCWRDEVFGRESGGFGLAGDDGLTEQRLAAMRVTGKLVQEQQHLIDNYSPTRPEVGVFFSPQTYYLHWAQEGHALRAMKALHGYCRSLVRNSIPYLVVEEEHLDVLRDLRILFMPRTLALAEPAETALTNFVKQGGTLVCESECGAFSPQGIYRYPPDRFTSRLTGICEVGRRQIDSSAVRTILNNHTVDLGVTQWVTPWQRGHGRILADGKEGALIVDVPIGNGKLILCGSYLGESYMENWTPDFETFVAFLVHQSGWKPTVEVLSPKPDSKSFVYIKTGESNGKRVIFVFFPPGQDEVHLKFDAPSFKRNRAQDLISGKTIPLSDTHSGRQCVLQASEWRFSVLVFD